MTIDEAIENYKKDSQFYNNEFEPQLEEEYKQLVEWLEELKAMRKLDKTNFSDGYNKAIDDCIFAIEKDKSLFDNHRHSCMADKTKIQNIIRNLKAGGENDD